MYSINERPNITSAVSTEDGYRARTLCLVDGFPAEVDIQVDTHRQKYSSFGISVYDAVRQEWGHRIATMSSEEVGRMPVLHDEPETLMKLNEVAGYLYGLATVIVRTARIRQQQLDEDEYVCNRLALSTARETARDDLEYAERQEEARATWKKAQITDAYGGISPAAHAFTESVNSDPFASGDHAEAEFAADASDEERQG